ncbi:hypothetical protein [Frankia sp. AiPa1]|uniref:hypothetical protein n=1 Tax=Frankia sp. AiPa1 TaxID=573492 RepID=UPI00202ADC17|nr:hypothetical protein [Frankia sp. AiPa1]MCL9759299.1 hypothetical protein [Frankia sp. AiPa1]
MTALALSGLVAVAVAGPASAAVPGGGGVGGPAPSVDGVTVGWLPSGTHLTNVLQTSRIGQPVIIGTFEGAGSYVSLTVQRSAPDATLADVAKAYTQYYPAEQVGRIAVRRTEAVTLSTSTGITELTWVEGRPSVVLTVGGSVVTDQSGARGPLPEADLLRIANSLRVGPAPKQTAWQKASEPRIRSAFGLALTSSSAPPQVALAAVENGPSLVGVLQKFRATYPGLTAKITVNSIYFWDNTRATVAYTIAYSYKGASGSIGLSGKAVFTQGRWKVSEQSYRAALNLAAQLG